MNSRLRIFTQEREKQNNDNIKRFKYYQIAIKTFELIEQYAELGEDYSLLQRSYNEMVDSYELDLQKIRYINNYEFEIIEI